MPKQENTRNNSSKSRIRASPYPSHHRLSSSSSSSSTNPPTPTHEETKEWEEARCSVCMEHPHNAVLLTCTSVKLGCRPFMCDTSYRHSNCLDQYKKAFTKISCPLCRGGVDGWSVDESARRYMDSKVRSCSKESCGFSGAYTELRKHARKEHPLDRPSTADPERQQDWQRMVQRRDFEDLMSTMRGELNGEEDGAGFERLFNEDDNEVGLVGRLRISPIAVLLLIRYTFRMDEGMERISYSPPPRSPRIRISYSPPPRGRESGEESNEESSDAEGDEMMVRERRWRVRERLRRRRMRFPDDYSDDGESDDGVIARRRMRLSPVAESDDDGNDEINEVHERPRRRRRRMTLLPDDDDDDEGGVRRRVRLSPVAESEDDRNDEINGVHERPRRRRRMTLLPDDDDDDDGGGGMVRRRRIRLSPVAEIDDDGNVINGVQERPRRRMRLLPDDGADDGGGDGGDHRVEERPRRRMRLPDDESDDYL